MTNFYDYLIIGGGIAGLSAAESTRGADSVGTIAVVSAEPYQPYSRVLLPSYLKGKISREKLFIRQPEDFAAQRIDFLPGRLAASVDAPGRRVVFADRQEIKYGKLLIAAGGAPRAWPYTQGERVFRLHTLDDADRLNAALDQIRRPLVIGGSFIALEYIDTFLARGIAPRVLVREAHFLGRMAEGAGGMLIADALRERRVEVSYRDGAAAVKDANAGDAFDVATQGSGVIAADALAVGIGISRNIGFLAGSGIACGNTGVLTDEFLETEAPGVFAAGDIAEYFDPIAGRHRVIGNWTHATLQGRRAGLNMAGQKSIFSSVPAYAITALGLSIAAVGDCDAQLASVSRIDSARRQYERFFMRGGALAGAFIINRAQDKPVLTDLILRRTIISPYADRLQDMAFDIRTLASV